MRPRTRIGVIAILVCLPTGCGTFQNLTAPPTPTPQPSLVGPSSCEPFGGFQRSAVMGQFLLASPLFPLGFVTLGVDAPLSLAADVLTLPVVSARKRGEPWATWWGAQYKKRTDEAKQVPDAPDQVVPTETANLETGRENGPGIATAAKAPPER